MSHTISGVPSSTIELFGSEEERRSFDFFRTSTTAQFAAGHAMASKFWHEYVMARASADSLIFKLAVAMGARHEATTSQRDDVLALATRSHGYVVSALARQLGQLPLQLSLLCCGMLIGFANLCEDVPVTAPVHLCLGTRILHENDTSPNTRDTSSNAGLGYLAAIFGELELTTALFTAPPQHDLEVLLGMQEEQAPVLPAFLDSLQQAKQYHARIHRYLLYVVMSHRHNLDVAGNIVLASALEEIEAVLEAWRQRLIIFSQTLLPTRAAEYGRARKMLFQNKLYIMSRRAARNDVFAHSTRVTMVGMDFRDANAVSVSFAVRQRVDQLGQLCTPLITEPQRATDDVDIWPVGEHTVSVGDMQIVKVSIGTTDMPADSCSRGHQSGSGKSGTVVLR
jgi:hypothetical protein